MKRWLWAVCAVAVAGCTRDAPLEVGEELLPGEAIRTFEVILEPQQYLVMDTSFGLYSEPEDANYLIMAREYGGALNSRALLRYVIPRTITIRTTTDSLKVDTLPSFFEAELRLGLDTVASTRPVELEAFFAMEQWDRATATWTHRIDSVGNRVAWSTPGGSTGPVIATSESVGDTVVLTFDSASVALIRDTLDATHGIVVGVATNDARVRTPLPSLRVKARSALRPDTIVEVIIAPSRTFIFEPVLSRYASDLRIGGTPQWRGILRMKERLDTVTVPCPGEPGCRVKLGDLALNSAHLRLQPTVGLPGFDPELDVNVAVHALLPDARVPLERSPITEAVGTTITPIPRSSFLAPNAPAVDISVSSLMALVLSGVQNQFVPSHLALAATGSAPTFGIATFAPMPRLRLVVSLTRELKLP